MTKPVKHFHSAMTGASSLTGAAGSLLAILKACLVDGFNLIALDSLVVAGGVLTGTKAGHGFVVDQVILIAGANESALNGEWTITSVTSSTFTAAATGVANTTGTGTITAKAAPAGWTAPYVGTNKAAFKPSDASASGCYLRVDDTGNTTARVVGYETMTDVDTGTGPFPTSTQMSGGLYWYKSATADATARGWTLIADGKMFYFIRHYYGTQGSTVDCFGDFISDKAGDAYNCALSGWLTINYIASSGHSPLARGDAATSTYYGIWTPRSYTQIGSAAVLTVQSMMVSTYGSGATGGLTYPSPVNNGLVLCLAALRESSGPFRCTAGLPGMYHTPQVTPLSDLDKITDIPGLSGRKLLISRVWTQGQEGRLAFDITGPWR